MFSRLLLIEVCFYQKKKGKSSANISKFHFLGISIIPCALFCPMLCVNATQKYEDKLLLNIHKVGDCLLISFIGALSPGCPMYKSPTVVPVSTPSNMIVEHGNLSSNANHPLTRKRTGSNVVAEVTPTAKKSRSKAPAEKILGKGQKERYLSVSLMSSWLAHVLSSKL